MEKKFCDNLKTLRNIKQLTQKQVADKLGIAVSSYANWEQGRTEPDIANIYKLLTAFEIDADELFDIN